MPIGYNSFGYSGRAAYSDLNPRDEPPSVHNGYNNLKIRYIQRTMPFRSAKFAIFKQIFSENSDRAAYM